MSLVVPNRPWESISMEFIGGVPITRKGHNYLFIVVDISTKCVIIPCKNTIIGHEETKLFFENI
jgi:hypothetical protein